MSLQASFSRNDVALQQEQGSFLWCDTDAELGAVQNAVTPPYPLGTMPQAYKLLCAIGQRTRVWVVTGICSFGEDEVGEKRLE